MAISTPNGTKANSGEVSQLLKMLRSLFTKPVAKAIDIILHPCCTLDLTVVETCYDNLNKTLTFTVANPIPFFDESHVAEIISSLDGVICTYGMPNNATISADGKTITLENVALTDGVTTFAVVVAYPTTSTKGVYISGSVTTTIVTCVP